jgi:hypothetical protein
VQAPVRCALVRRRAVRGSQGSAEPPELLQPDRAVYLASAILLKPTAAMPASWVAFAGGGVPACRRLRRLRRRLPPRPSSTHEAGSPVADQSLQQAWMVAEYPGRQPRGVIGVPEGISPVVDMGSGKS